MSRLLTRHTGLLIVAKDSTKQNENSQSEVMGSLLKKLTMADGDE
jgi:hypothetical protein